MGIPECTLEETREGTMIFSSSASNFISRQTSDVFKEVVSLLPSLQNHVYNVYNVLLWSEMCCVCNCAYCHEFMGIMFWVGCFSPRSKFLSGKVELCVKLDMVALI